jgi:hypothetical protein
MLIAWMHDALDPPGKERGLDNRRYVLDHFPMKLLYETLLPHETKRVSITQERLDHGEIQVGLPNATMAGL